MDELFNLFYDKEYQERLGRALYPWAFPPEDPLPGADGAVRGLLSVLEAPTGLPVALNETTTLIWDEDWAGELTFTTGGTAIIRGEKGENSDAVVRSEDDGAAKHGV